MSAYTEALLLRLRHIVYVRQSPRLWQWLDNGGQFLLYQMLKASTEDAVQEGLENQVLEILPPEMVQTWR